MIRHHAFFEALGALDDKTPEWTSAFAGLSVMRLVDRFAEEGEAANPAEWSELYATQSSVEEIDVGNPARAINLRIVDHISTTRGLSPELGLDLLSYGRALDLEAEWALAADVFQSTARIFSELKHPKVVIEASLALGAAARNAGDWNTSERAYSRGEHLAHAIGSNELALTAQIGMAGSQMVQGNLPAAETELEEVLAEAARSGLQNVEALALHSRASVAHSRGEYQKAVHYAYRSLELTTNSSARDRILADIAAAYAGLGMRATARDGYSIVAMTSPHQWVRWQATLNLMELAIEDGDQGGFRRLQQEMESAALDPRLHAYFLFFEALASRRFGTGDFDSQFTRARDYAEDNRLHQLAFQIEEAMTEQIVPPAARESGTSESLSANTEELTRIAEVLGHLRENASA